MVEYMEEWDMLDIFTRGLSLFDEDLTCFYSSFDSSIEANLLRSKTLYKDDESSTGKLTAHYDIRQFWESYGAQIETLGLEL